MVRGAAAAFLASGLRLAELLVLAAGASAVGVLG
jgi:hypothetical protein